MRTPTKFYFFGLTFDYLDFSHCHLHRKFFPAGVHCKTNVEVLYSAPLIRTLLIGIIILGVTKEGRREIVRFSESFCPNSIVLVVILKMMIV